MGPVNWLVVILAANLAVAVGIVWYGPVFGGGRPLWDGHLPDGSRKPRSWTLVIGVMLVGATMLGHNFARIGAETLHAKPWLYFMMAGGFALWFVAPALYIGLARHGVSPGDRWRDCGYWVAAYLAMATVFWALG
jgi:RsiW-degrading membrane proteinase PrsW (M82 family)